MKDSFLTLYSEERLKQGGGSVYELMKIFEQEKLYEKWNFFKGVLNIYTAIDLLIYSENVICENVTNFIECLIDCNQDE